MLNISAVIHQSLRLMPKRQALVETLGFGLLGFGLFLSLASLTFDPNDYLASRYSTDSISNLAGPMGAWFAYQVLGYFGVIGMLWPICLVIWGALIVIGFEIVPGPKRIVGFILFMIVLAALTEVQLSVMTLSEPYFGFGGSIGRALGLPIMKVAGYGGALIILSAMGFIALVISGNLAISRTKSHLGFVGHVLFRAGGELKKSMSNKALTDEELIKLALMEEARNSRSLAKVRDGVQSDAVASGSRAISGKARNLSKRGSKKKDKPIDIANLAEEAMSDIESGRDSLELDDVDTIDFYYRGKPHPKPVAQLFSASSKPIDRSSEFDKMAAKLTAQLAEFKVMGKVRKIIEGPVVTTFEFDPLPGTKVSKITGLAADLARMLGAKSLRILAPIPGKKVVGFEVPNKTRRMIGFADLVSHRTLKSSKVSLPVAMGMDTFGKVIIEDLAKMPHLLVAGSTGSGKSVFMNSLIGGLVARHSAKDLRFMMVDPKMVEMAAYNDLPHMACPVITDPSGDAKDKLDALVAEMENRFDLMSKLGTRNVIGFNEIIKKSKRTDFPKFDAKWQTMPYIVLIIDELADMMMVLGKDAEVPITRLAQKARAAGIHLVIATQRPSADVVTGLIKANFPTRVAFRVLSGTDSRTILDTGGAEGLIGQGDMLYLGAGGLRRMHGAFLSDDEVQKLVSATKR